LKRIKLSYFNCTADAPHIGCLAVTNSHISELLYNGYEISKFYFTKDTKSIFNKDKTISINKLKLLGIEKEIENSDAVIINGEGSLHHNKRRDLLIIAEYCINIKKPVYLINCTIQEIEDFDDVFRKLDDLVVRDFYSSEYLRKKKIEHRIVLDSILGADFNYEKSNTSSNKKIAFTDWQGQLENTVGSTLINFKENNQNSEYFPMHDLKYFHNKIWKDTIKTFENFFLILSARHHANYIAGLSNVPFIPFKSNSYKIEGTIKLSKLKIPICNKQNELEQLIKYTLNNSQIYNDFHHWLIENKNEKKSHFEKLFDKFGVNKIEDRDILQINKNYDLILKNKIYENHNQYLFNLAKKMNKLSSDNKFIEFQNKKKKLIHVNIKSAKKYKKVGNYETAKNILIEHLKEFKEDSLAKYHLGLSYLFLNNKEGFKFICSKSSIDAHLPLKLKRKKIDTWKGEEQNKKVLIWSDKGLGIGVEFFMITNFLNQENQNLKKYFFICDSRLSKYFNKLYNCRNFLGYNDEIKISSNYLQCNILSLFEFIFKRENFNFKINKDEDFLEKREIGFSCISTNQSDGIDRSIPIEKVILFEKLNNYELYNLNLKKLRPGPYKELPLRNLNFEIKDNFDLLIDKIKKFKLVVTIDSSNAFFALACGTPCILIISNKNNWFWNFAYNKVFKFNNLFIFKKKDEQNWDSFINEIISFINKKFS